MKKSDLRETFGSLHARDEQISRVMESVAARKQKAENKPAMSRFNFGMRLATAACAFMIVIGLGVHAFTNELFKEPEAVDHSIQRANETDGNVALLAQNDENNNSHDPADKTDLLAELLAESDQINGDWAIIRGTANAFYFAGGEVENGAYHCIIAVSVENTEKTSDGIEVNENEIVADVTFASDDELNEFTDSISSTAAFLIVKNGSDSDTAWTVKKIVY